MLTNKQLFQQSLNALLVGIASLGFSGLQAQPALKDIGAWVAFHGSRFMAGVTAGKGLSMALPLWKDNRDVNDLIKNIKSGPTRLVVQTIKDQCLPTVAKLATLAYMPQLLNMGTNKLPARAAWLKPAAHKQDTSGRMAFLLGMAAGPLLKLITYQYELPVPLDGWQKPL